MFAYLTQFLYAMSVTLEVAVCAAALGLVIGLCGALFESLPYRILRYSLGGVFFLIRGLPEILVLFFIYFGITAILSELFGKYIDISPFVASVCALSLMFGAYASHVFRGALLAVGSGQVEAGAALGLNRLQTFIHIQIPQAWRHALPGLGNLWLVLLKDTAIVMLIGLTDIMGQAKLSATATHEPFTFYLLAAFMYLFITTLSQKALAYFTQHANRYITV